MDKSKDAVKPNDDTSPSEPDLWPSTTTAVPPGTKSTLRAIKNRQSAQASRDRKRRHLVELERQRAALLLENKRLQERVAELEEDRLRLGATVSDLQADFVTMRDMLRQLTAASATTTATTTATATTTTKTDKSDMASVDTPAKPTAPSSPSTILGRTVGAMPVSPCLPLIRSGGSQKKTMTMVTRSGRQCGRKRVLLLTVRNKRQQKRHKAASCWLAALLSRHLHGSCKK